MLGEMIMNVKTSFFISREKFIREVVRDKQLYFMILPVIIWYILFQYLPMYSIQIAFKDYSIFKGITGSAWVGLKNFRDFFGGVYAWRTIRNTLLINIYQLLTVFPLTIILALLLNELRYKKLKSVVQTMIYLPHFISAVVVAGLVISFLSPEAGIINSIIAMFGGEKIYFLIKPEYFRAIYITMGGWQGIGFGTILYTSALCSIDSELYQAASIDGAGRFKRIIHITIPGIMPTIAVMLILRMGSMLSSGTATIILLYQPITYETADTIGTFVYRSGLLENNFSLSTAVGLFEGVVSFILVLGTNILSKKVGETSLW